MELNFIPDKKYYDFKIGYVFGLFSIFYILVSFYTNHYIITRSLYFESFANQLPVDKIYQLLSFKRKWEWIGLAITPALLFVRISFTIICVLIGCFLSEIKITGKNVFRIVLVAELFFAIGLVTRIIWLTFTPINSFVDIQNFSPLSLAQLLGPTNIPKYLLYLCQTINIFEIAYWLVLAAGLVAFLGKPFGKMFKLVMSSYGLGLLLWIVFVSYLTVTFSA